MIPKNYQLEKGESIGSTKFRYRLLADGTIVDQEEKNRVVGFISNKAELDELWSKRGSVLQKLLKTKLFYAPSIETHESEKTQERLRKEAEHHSQQQEASDSGQGVGEDAPSESSSPVAPTKKMETQEKKLLQKIIAIPIFEDDEQQILVEARRGGINAMLSILGHNQRIINEKLDKVLAGNKKPKVV